MKKIFFIFLFLVSFNLLSQEESKPKEIVLTTNDSLKGKEFDNVPFDIIEEIPVFPGCEKIKKGKKMKCFHDKMNKHIIKHFTYPTDALEDNIQGKVDVSFMINIVGDVVDIETSGADPILQEEVRRIISLLPKFQPGFQKGKPVNVRYAMPLNFRLR